MLINHFINLGDDKEMISEILSNIKVDNSKSLKLEYEKQSEKYIRACSYKFEFIGGKLKYINIEYMP